MYMYIYIYECMYYACMYTLTRIHTRIHTHMCACANAVSNTYSARMYIYNFTHMSTYISTHSYTHGHIHIHTYIHTHPQTHTHGQVVLRSSGQPRSLMVEHSYMHIHIHTFLHTCAGLDVLRSSGQPRSLMDDDSLPNSAQHNTGEINREISAQNPTPWVRLSEASDRGMSLTQLPTLTSDLFTKASPASQPASQPGFGPDPFSAAFGCSEPGGLSLNEIVIETREDAIKRSRARNKAFSMYGMPARSNNLSGAGVQEASTAGGSMSSAKMVLENKQKPGTKAYEVSAAIVSVHGTPSKDKNNSNSNSGTPFSLMATEAADAARHRLADGKGANSPAPQTQTQALNSTEPLFPSTSSAMQALAHLEAAGAALQRASASALGSRTASAGGADDIIVTQPQTQQAHARRRNMVDKLSKITTPRNDVDAQSSPPPPASGSQAPSEGTAGRTGPALPPRMKYHLPTMPKSQTQSEATSALPSPRRK